MAKRLYPRPAIHPAANHGFVISDGRYFAQTNLQLLYETIARIGSDVVAVDVELALRPAMKKYLPIRVRIS